MVVEELRTAGSKPGRFGASSEVEEGEACGGNGEGTRSLARSVSTKKPPSMCGMRLRALIMVRIWGGSGVLGVAVKLGVKRVAIAMFGRVKAEG